MWLSWDSEVDGIVFILCSEVSFSSFLPIPPPAIVVPVNPPHLLFCSFAHGQLWSSTLTKSLGINREWLKLPTSPADYMLDGPQSDILAIFSILQPPL